MTAKILHGEEIAAEYRGQIAREIGERTREGYPQPKLAVVLVGEDPASVVYVRNKRRACAEVGIAALDYNLPQATSQNELLSLVQKLNDDPQVNGILVQMPLPKHIDQNLIIDAIDPHKDVDGFTPYNIGRLAQGRPYMRPCTPAGIMLLLAQTKEQLSGKIAVVVGTSNIVGKPMVLELLLAGCTVICCNSKTLNLAQELGKADIIIVAIGKPGFIKGAWIKPGSIVVDVGMNRTSDGHLVGDIEFAAAKERASWITPVPRGVGPMTVACLMGNSLRANIDQNKRVYENMG